MQWLESALFTGGMVFLVLGLFQWFGVMRAERDPAVITRTRRIAAGMIGLGAVALVAHLVLVLA